ncbi:TIGR03668 family PPOX class F420-dependent oxidoreductase [soil metagenome]
MADPADIASRFAAAPVARLATVASEGTPHLVPVVFAMRDQTVLTAVDGKPNSTQRLKRLANIAANPQVSLLVDHYADDWSTLWWIRADGIAQIIEDDPALDLLRAKYPQYQTVSLGGPVICIEILRWASWGLG